MSNTTYINIVSGKGGTGKTLLCTILADMLGTQNSNVLIIDMDIFVRGLTSLLYFHKGETLNLTNKDELSISDLFYNYKLNHWTSPKLSIHKYRSFDIIPAVSKINELFDYEKDTIFDYTYNHDVFKKLFNLIPKDEYDFVFFDCRAGYDNLISIVHEFSDITLCVQEEDDISEITADNLVRQLEKDNSRKSVYKIINKARNIKTILDLEQKRKQGITFLGYIPFDMDIMNSFGENSFWDDISQTLYKSALSDVWNSLAKKENLNIQLNFKRYSPLVVTELEMQFGYLQSKNRVLALAGLLLSTCGIVYIFFQNEIIKLFEHVDRLIAVLISLFGFIVYVYSTLIRRK